jgi:dihydrofolate reductase
MAGTIAIDLFVTLDGVGQAPGQPDEDREGGFRFGGWQGALFDEVVGRSVGERLADIDALLLGRRTYDIFAAYWPYNRDNPIGEKFQRINKYVLTHSDEPLTWENSHKLSGSTADAVAELKNSEGRDLLIQGSSTLYPPLLSARAIDRLILITFPIVLGQGKRLFDGSEQPSGLKLVDHFVSPKGVVITSYEPAGEVPTGSFAGNEPSAEELERRRKIAAGTW